MLKVSAFTKKTEVKSSIDRNEKLPKYQATFFSSLKLPH